MNLARRYIKEFNLLLGKSSQLHDFSPGYITSEGLLEAGTCDNQVFANRRLTKFKTRNRLIAIELQSNSSSRETSTTATGKLRGETCARASDTARAESWSFRGRAPKRSATVSATTAGTRSCHPDPAKPVLNRKTTITAATTMAATKGAVTAASR